MPATRPTLPELPPASEVFDLERGLWVPSIHGSLTLLVPSADHFEVERPEPGVSLHGHFGSVFGVLEDSQTELAAALALAHDHRHGMEWGTALEEGRLEGFDPGAGRFETATLVWLWERHGDATLLALSEPERIRTAWVFVLGGTRVDP